ncbi:prenyltransferase [Aquisphaera giovannonii]|uniref:Prenyltransferase n=2 Tax=Aquisphaera giovannonii TaxID=406548 RepID=A0A5B9WCV4_9BACT|nr:prenyltransferase [Aquisphaera giovannonii]
MLAWLQLVRLPNVLTAAADGLAGWLLAGGSLAEPARWGPLVAASMTLYAAGMALNDAFDREVDRRERPSRPIPSGRVSPRAAFGLGFAGLLLGPLLAAASGSASSAAVAAALALAILAYDAGGKRTPLGPLIMGSCRALNLLLGLSHAPALGGPAAWLAASMYGMFVAGITWMSRSETESGRTRNLLAGLAVQDVALVGLMAAALRAGRFPGARAELPLISPEALLLLALVGLAINSAAGRAIREPVPARIQGAVKAGILSLVWIDAALVMAVRGPAAASAIAAIWAAAYLLGRMLYST